MSLENENENENANAIIQVPAPLTSTLQLPHRKTKTKDKRQSGWTSLRRHAHCIQPTGSRQRQTQRQTSRRRCRRSFSRRRSKGDQEFVRTKWGGGSRPQTAGASITRDADGGQTTTTRGYVHAPYNKTKNRRYQKHASRTAGGSLLELNIKWNGPHGGMSFGPGH